MGTKKRRPSLKDVAEMAGVGTATVDRVMNDRGNVKEATAIRIREVATQLGFRSGIYREEVSFNVLLQDPEHPYYRELGQSIKSEASAYRKDGLRVAIHYLADTSDAAVVEKLRELASSAYGVAGVFVQNTQVVEAVRRVREQGKPVVTLLTDLRHSFRTAYLGPDNRMVGRTAGYLVGRLCRQAKGQVLVTAETLNYLSLEEREMGFRSILLERFPHLVPRAVLERNVSRDTMVERVAELVKNPDVVGIYNAGGRNRVVADAMQLAGRQPGDIVFVGSQLTDSSRRLLVDGWMDATIGFPATSAARAIVQAILAAAGRPAAELPAFQPFQIYFVENAVVRV